MSNVVISVDEYFKLVKDQEKLNALEMGGVDNWEGYGDALYEDPFGEPTEWSTLDDMTPNEFIEAYQIETID